MKVKYIALAAAGLGLGALAAALGRRIATMRSVQHVGGPLYQVNYTADYKLDTLLTGGVKDVAQLTAFLSKEIFLGYPIKLDEEIKMGCTCFACETPEGEYLAARNFDYAKTDMLLVQTRPRGGYASYSMACLAHLDISPKKGITPTGLLGRAMILAAPFACVDGLNEKGLHVSVLELKTAPTRQSTGKPPIITTVAIRACLDKCANTAEAIALLARYDMQSSAGAPYHFFLTDASGHTAVVAWPDPTQDMVVLDENIAANYQLAPGPHQGVGFGQDRYNTVEEALAAHQGILNEETAMHTLAAARQTWNGTWHTLWSAVYNCTHFSVNLCCNRDYNTTYSFDSRGSKIFYKYFSKKG